MHNTIELKACSNNQNPVMPVAIIFTTILLLCSNSVLWAQTTNRDTTFLLKNTKGTQHYIFIEPNKASPFYDEVADFSIEGLGEQSYQNSLAALHERHLELGRIDIADFPTQWIITHQYKGQCYLYRPSDFYTHFQMGLTDSSFVDYTGEGPIANKILRFTKKDKSTYLFVLTGMYDSVRTITVHIIDRKKGIAVFEENTNGEGTHFFLMVDARKRRQLPLIVNYCKTQKQPEFRFDEPGFVELLQK